MTLDIEALDGPQNIQTDICIIGGGVAGQALATELSGTALKVTMLESGGRDFRRDTQALSAGKNLGLDYYDLITTRLRLFGGTAAIWGGRCAELDPIDFEKRDHVAHSGWPFSKAELDPYYQTVFDGMGLRKPEGLWDYVGRKAPEFAKDKLEAGLWVFDEMGERFTNPENPSFGNCDVLLNATVTEIEKTETGEITSVLAKSLKDTEVRVHAKVFVLAAGAMESARLLLAAGGGLGNAHDQVGRYFMEHPHARGGELVTENKADALRILPRAIRHDGRRYAAYLRPSETLQMQEGILNSSLSLTVRRRAGADQEGYRKATEKLKHDLPSSRFWRSLYHKGKGVALKGLEKTDPWSSVLNMKLSGGKNGIFAVIRAEQSPNPDSRVTLSAEKDALGMPRANLDWRMQDIDRRTIKVMMETMRDEFARLGHGTVVPSDWMYDETIVWKTDPLISAHPIGGYHHMGGLRMSASAKTGVVDTNCKLHDSPNLYVAGSAVFPTGGWANPTITIMALARRLGVHLKQNMI